MVAAAPKMLADVGFDKRALLTEKVINFDDFSYLIRMDIPKRQVPVGGILLSDMDDPALITSTININPNTTTIYATTKSGEAWHYKNFFNFRIIE